MGMFASWLVLISRSPKIVSADPPDDPFHRPPIKQNKPATTDDTSKNKSFHAAFPKGHIEFCVMRTAERRLKEQSMS
jgi:hypothetical protein